MLKWQYVCWIRIPSTKERKKDVGLVNISITKTQCMAHNTDQICGCPFNCVWTDFSKYLMGCICIFGIGVIILAMKSNILVLEKWIEYENPSKTDGIQQNEMVPCDSNDWNS